MLLLASVLMPSGAQAEPPWQPPPEPARWAEVRRTLLRLGPPQGLAPRRWRFLRALDRDDLRAGEYMAGLRSAGGATEPMAEFTGAVLLQRPAGGDSSWQVRERRMRLFCHQGRMEVMGPDGEWTVYAGASDPEAPARRSWICAEALRRSADAVPHDRVPRP